MLRRRAAPGVWRCAPESYPSGTPPESMERALAKIGEAIRAYRTPIIANVFLVRVLHLPPPLATGWSARSMGCEAVKRRVPCVGERVKSRESERAG